MELTFSWTRLQSQLVGIIGHIPVPETLRYVLWHLFVLYEGINMDEVLDTDFGHYPTFASFFGREVKPEARPIDRPSDCSKVASPSDGHALSVGEINTENFTIECVKGRPYRLDEFMLGVKGDGEVSPYGDEPEPPINSGVKALVDKVKQRGNKLMYTVIYLSPADYHRYRSPTCHSADYRRHIAGFLTLVRASYTTQHPDTYKTNERVSIFGRWQQGFLFYAPVGATNVGSILLNFDEELKTDVTSPPYPFYYDKSYSSDADSTPFSKYLSTTDFSHIDQTVPNFSKGEATGKFDMGSTVVVIFEAEPEMQWAVKAGQKLKVGQSLVV